MNTVAGTIERVYDAYFKGTGLCIDLSVRCQGFGFSKYWKMIWFLIFIRFRSPFHEVYKENPIELGKGFDISFPFILNITYISFKHTSGYILFVSSSFSCWLIIPL